MKNLILITTLLFSFGKAEAVPVMNENASTSALVTIFPDHADPNVFYFAPNVLSVCLDQNNRPRFSYLEISANGGLHAIVQMTYCPRFLDKEIEASKAGILARVPTARFVALPFLSSKMEFNTVFEPFVIKEFCTHTAGLVGDEQTCSFRLNIRGRQVFLKNIRERLAMTNQYTYQVSGFIRLPDGTFGSQLTEYGVAARVGGEELFNFPELFVDRHGRPLKFK